MISNDVEQLLRILKRYIEIKFSLILEVVSISHVR